MKNRTIFRKDTGRSSVTIKCGAKQIRMNNYPMNDKIVGKIVSAIKLPGTFRADIVRSDGLGQSTVYMTPTMRRIDNYVNGTLASITISRSDESRLWKHDLLTGSVHEFPLPEIGDYDPTEECSWRYAGTEQVDGFECDKYELLHQHIPNYVTKTVAVDSQTQMRIRLQTFNKLGQMVLTVEYKNIHVGPLPLSYFEIPPHRNG